MSSAASRQQLGREEFVSRYGSVYEHSPWVAEESFAVAAGIEGVDQLAEIFAACVDRADHEQKLVLIRAHPDLAGKAAISGELTGASSAEQASAGIDQCSGEEYQRFQDLNRRYRKKFGFPFVMAVRGSDRHEILAAFESRLDNDSRTEFDRAIREIHKIAYLRLRELEA
jgi:OHCU decarboxylase